MSNFTTEVRRRGENQNWLIRGSADLVVRKTLAWYQRQRAGANVGASQRVYVFLQSAVHVLKATLREIFDEAAYDRFLARTHSRRSVVSYRAFLHEREDAFARKQRCC